MAVVVRVALADGVLVVAYRTRRPASRLTAAGRCRGRRPCADRAALVRRGRARAATVHGQPEGEPCATAGAGPRRGRAGAEVVVRCAGDRGIGAEVAEVG